jgi:hypothetical protein
MARSHHTNDQYWNEFLKIKAQIQWKQNISLAKYPYEQADKNPTHQ